MAGLQLLHKGLKGSLRRWNQERKFGFLHIDSDPALCQEFPSGVFVHRRELPKNRDYGDGDEFSFDIFLDADKGKPECCNVTMLQSKALQRARIVKWNGERGFGFAEAQDGTQVFVHSRMVNGQQLAEGMTVSLNYRENPKKPNAYEAVTVMADEGYAADNGGYRSFESARGGGRGGGRGRGRGRGGWGGGRNRERDYYDPSANSNGWISTDVTVQGKQPGWQSGPPQNSWPAPPNQQAPPGGPPPQQFGGPYQPYQSAPPAQNPYQNPPPAQNPGYGAGPYAANQSGAYGAGAPPANPGPANPYGAPNQKPNPYGTYGAPPPQNQNPYQAGPPAAQPYQQGAYGAGGPPKAW